MKELLKYYFFILLLSFTVLAPSNTYSYYEYQNEKRETDRVIVEITDTSGNKSVKSMTWEEFESSTRPKSSLATSSVKNSQKVKEVKMLEPDYIRSTDVVTQSMQVDSWGTKRIGAKEVMKKFLTKNDEIIVAVIDTGVDYTHSLLENRVVNGYDFIDNDTDPMDAHYHGTHVAGIIIDSTPVNVKIMPIRALDEKGEGYDTNIAKGIRFAVDNGASVINMSFGGENFSNHLADAMEYALINNVLIVVSSGNESSDTANYYPASEQKVIVVSATDSKDLIANFSNTGAAIDVSAPGVGIISSIPGDKYARLNGTSMAAPYVSAVAAMIKLDDSTRSIQEIEQLLKKYVDDRGAVGWDPLYGEGIVNITTYEHDLPVNPIDALSNYTALPGIKNVSLDKQWSIKFNRVFTDASIISVKVSTWDSEIPITLSPNSKDREMIVTPNVMYESNRVYLLEITIKNGKKYQMQFVTAS